MNVRRSLRIVLPLALLAAVAGAWGWSSSHPILPGIGGCGWVREVGPRIECLADRIEASVESNGLEATAEQVDGLLASRAIGRECHLAWHPAGERRGAAAARDGDELPELASASWCTQGFDHGFLLGYLGTEGAAIDSERMARTCHAIASEGVINCVHAFGHAFAREAGGDLDAAWGHCVVAEDAEIVADSKRAPEELHAECMSGAAMENAMNDRDDGVDQVRRSDCADLDQARAFCVDYAPVRATLLGDDRDPAAVCAEATADAAERRSCASATASSR